MEKVLTEQELIAANETLRIVDKHGSSIDDVQLILMILKMAGLGGTRTLKAMRAMVEIAEVD